MENEKILQVTEDMLIEKFDCSIWAVKDDVGNVRCSVHGNTREIVAMLCVLAVEMAKDVNKPIEEFMERIAEVAIVIAEKRK